MRRPGPRNQRRQTVRHACHRAAVQHNPIGASPAMCDVRLRHRELWQRPKLPHVSHPQMDHGSPREPPRPTADVNEESITLLGMRGPSSGEGGGPATAARRRELEDDGPPHPYMQRWRTAGYAAVVPRGEFPMWAVEDRRAR